MNGPTKLLRIYTDEAAYFGDHKVFEVIAARARDAKLAGISNIEDQSSDRVGLRIVVEVKRDAVIRHGDGIKTRIERRVDDVSRSPEVLILSIARPWRVHV